MRLLTAEELEQARQQIIDYLFNVLEFFVTQYMSWSSVSTFTLSLVPRQNKITISVQKINCNIVRRTDCFIKTFNQKLKLDFDLSELKEYLILSLEQVKVKYQVQFLIVTNYRK